MDDLWKIFLRGLATVVPVAVTISILYWIGISLETVLGGILQLFIPEKYYVPGTGLIVALLATFVVGATAHAWIIAKLIQLGEGMIGRIPLAKTIYGGVRDLMKFISTTADRKDLDQVVMIDVPGDMRMVGFVTGHGIEIAQSEEKKNEMATVYIPFSYQIGGHTVCVPRSKLKALDVPVESAMRWVFTAGVSTDDE
ncbi:MAG: DUF502 domain-containing protein [Gammaproteobacteria bacterium]|nr:DUF502 domain-containing protein [Gammaproteobacteria bacterium]MDH3412319.1 DUF502 domain-containing protein [Gammaproteobacteria bacterium]